jgi:hypothetical protein
VRPGDGALTASVRGGPIGVNRIDLPVTQILLTGRALRDAAPDQVYQAIRGQTPSAAIARLSALGGASTLALVVHPRPDRARDTPTAAQLARQDQAATNTSPSAPRALPGRPRQPALPAPSAIRAQPASL